MTMGVDFDVDAEVAKELQLLQAQLEHSRAQRKRRDDIAQREKEKELVKELNELKEVVRRTTPQQETLPAPAAPPELGFNDGASVVSAAASSTAPSTAFLDKPANTAEVVAATGQIQVRKPKKRPQMQGAASPNTVVDTASVSDISVATSQQTSAPLNPAEIKRQREEEQKQRKAQQEAEEAARLAAQKTDPASEKGGWVEVYEKSWKGWGKSSFFAVARKEGFFLYKQEPQGRGSTSGGVKYDQSAKPAELVEYEKLVQNSRGSSKPHKSQLSRTVAKDEHPKSEGKQDFGINYFDGKSYQWKLFLCQSVQDRDQWCDFLGKFLKERKF